MNNNLGIGFRVEPMSSGFEASAKLYEIEYLTVEDEPECFVFIMDWLTSRLKVNNAESTHPQRDIVFYIVAFIVRAAMCNNIAHSPQQFLVDLRSAATGDSTQSSGLPSCTNGLLIAPHKALTTVNMTLRPEEFWMRSPKQGSQK
jgi:hypothetical protein